jgi:hypothetical protein
MTSASAIDELYRIETWASRVDIMGGLKDTGMFPDEWIIERFTDLPADEMKLLKLTKDASGGGDSEEDKDFFEDKTVGKLINEDVLFEINKLKQLIKDDKTKHSNHISMQKMLNDNEFDGLNGEEYLNEDSTVAKNIVERLLKEEFNDDISSIGEDDDNE